MSDPKYLIVSFDHQYLTENPHQLNALAKFYCSIWERDENFGEYRQCPNPKCRRYFNYQQVEHENILSCTDCDIPLVLAWEPEDVARNLLEKSNQSADRFSGFLALDPDGKIIGFAWARILEFKEITSSWGEKISSQLHEINDNPLVAYFNELAVAPHMRGHNVGKDMVRLVSEWMKSEHSEKMALLRTHEASKARYIYEKVGYSVFATDTEHGYGRIMMMANPCSSLPVSNLV